MKAGVYMFLCFVVAVAPYARRLAVSLFRRRTSASGAGAARAKSDLLGFVGLALFFYGMQRTYDERSERVEEGTQKVLARLDALGRDHVDLRRRIDDIGAAVAPIVSSAHGIVRVFESPQKFREMLFEMLRTAGSHLRTTRQLEHQNSGADEQGYFDLLVERALRGGLDVQRLVEIPNESLERLNRDLLARLAQGPNYELRRAASGGPRLPFELLISDDRVIFAFADGKSGPQRGIMVTGRDAARAADALFQYVWDSAEIIKGPQPLSGAALAEAQSKLAFIPRHQASEKAAGAGTPQREAYEPGVGASGGR